MIKLTPCICEHEGNVENTNRIDIGNVAKNKKTRFFYCFIP